MDSNRISGYREAKPQNRGMVPLPKTNPAWVPMTAEELLSIRGTPEFEVEYRRQRRTISEHQRNMGHRETTEYFDWNVPGWNYDAEL